MRIFIGVSMPYGDDEMVVEVVDDFECFSPSLLAGYPITEMECENLYMDPQDYARKHKLTPIRLFINTSHGSHDDMWTFERGAKTHQVYRVGHTELICVLVTHDMPDTHGMFARYYDLEGVPMPVGDARRAAFRIRDQWENDCRLAYRAGRARSPKDIPITVDGEVQDETI